MQVLAVFAHPDDETLACGATLAQHARRGDRVGVLTFTDGVGSRGVSRAAYVDVGRRSAEHDAALRVLGARRVGAQPQDRRTPDWSDQGLDLCYLPHLAQAVRNAVSEMEAELVYTHWPHDLNGDHRRVAEAVLVATRPAESRVRTVLACEIPESTHVAFGWPPFAPNVFVAVSGKEVEMKLEAMAAYASEARPWPHPRSLRAIMARASMWGGLSGQEMSEAFVLLREVWCGDVPPTA